MMTTTIQLTNLSPSLIPCVILTPDALVRFQFQQQCTTLIWQLSVVVDTWDTQAILSLDQVVHQQETLARVFPTLTV